MWPFRKKDTPSQPQDAKTYYLFCPAEDVTPRECAAVVADFIATYGRIRFTDQYVASMAEPMRRHFKPVEYIEGPPPKK